MEGNRKNKVRPRGILVFGAPCSGKTTFAKKFAEKFGLAYYDLNILKEKNFTREQILNILELLTKTGQTLLLEGEIGTEQERTEIRNVLRNEKYDPALVWIQTDVPTIRMRMKAKHRSVSKAKEIYDAAVAELEAPADFEKAIILSGKHTFETQTKHALKGLSGLEKQR